MSQRTIDCLRCRRPVEPPYDLSAACVNGLTLEGPVCAECRAVRGEEFFREGAWADRYDPGYFTGADEGDTE